MGRPRFPRDLVPFWVGQNRTQIRERSRALLGSRGFHLKTCPGLGTPATPGQPRVLGCLDAAFRWTNGVGVAMMNDVGAESSWPAFLLCTLPPVGRPPKGNTRFRSARYGFDRAGLSPAGFLKGVSSTHLKSSPSALTSAIARSFHLRGSQPLDRTRVFRKRLFLYWRRESLRSTAVSDHMTLSGANLSLTELDVPSSEVKTSG